MDGSRFAGRPAFSPSSQPFCLNSPPPARTSQPRVSGRGNTASLDSRAQDPAHSPLEDPIDSPTPGPPSRKEGMRPLCASGRRFALARSPQRETAMPTGKGCPEVARNLTEDEGPRLNIFGRATIYLSSSNRPKAASQHRSGGSICRISGRKYRPAFLELRTPPAQSTSYRRVLELPRHLVHPCAPGRRPVGGGQSIPRCQTGGVKPDLGSANSVQNLSSG